MTYTTIWGGAFLGPKSVGDIVNLEKAKVKNL